MTRKRVKDPAKSTPGVNSLFSFVRSHKANVWLSSKLRKNPWTLYRSLPLSNASSILRASVPSRLTAEFKTKTFVLKLWRQNRRIRRIACSYEASGLDSAYSPRCSGLRPQTKTCARFRASPKTRTFILQATGSTLLINSSSKLNDTKQIKRHRINLKSFCSVGDNIFNQLNISNPSARSLGAFLHLLREFKTQPTIFSRA